MAVRRKWGPLPRRLARDPRYLACHPTDRAILLGIYLVADEHGRFCAEDLVLRRDIAAYGPVRPCVNTLARLELVYLYRSDGADYGALQAFDFDWGVFETGRRPQPTYPSPPPDVWELARCNGHFKQFKGTDQRDDPDECAEVVEPGPCCTHAPFTLGTTDGDERPYLVDVHHGPSTAGQFAEDCAGLEPVDLDAVAGGFLDRLSGALAGVARAWLAEYDRRMRHVGPAVWTTAPMEDALSLAYRRAEVARVADMVGRLVTMRGELDVRCGMWAMMAPTWVWDRVDPIPQLLDLVGTIRERVDRTTEE